jgi:hypothetical protein
MPAAAVMMGYDHRIVGGRAAGITTARPGRMASDRRGGIHRRRKRRFAPQCTPLREEDRAIFTLHFPADDLDRVRVRDIQPARVPNPSFYPYLQQLGFANLPNFTSMAAITFDDVVVSHVSFTPRLLFHELVHVVQYRLLGIEEFSRLYVQGFLRGASYDAIPLEMCAYELEDRFIGGGNPFSVAHEVESCIAEGRF